MLRGILARNTHAITQTHIHTPRTTHPYSQLAFPFSPRGLKQRKGVLTEKLHTHFNGGSNAVTTWGFPKTIYIIQGNEKESGFYCCFESNQFNNETIMRHPGNVATILFDEQARHCQRLKEWKTSRRLCANGACHLTACANQRLAQIFDLIDHFDCHTMMND